MKTKYLDSLVQIGLTDKEARVYEALLTIPEASIGQLAMRVVGVTRPNLYPLLHSLSKKGLVIEAVKGKIKTFRAEPPQKLSEVIAKREQEYKEAQMSYKLVLPQLASDFNLASGKPNIQYYEGAKGMEKVFFDSLKTSGEILTYVDSSIVHELFAEVNARYVKERYRLGIKKKIIGPDSATLRETARNSNKELTEVRALPQEFGPFPTVLQIYDDCISYQTIEKDTLVGAIIQDKRIAELQRKLFAFNWLHAIPLDASLTA